MQDLQETIDLRKQIYSLLQDPIQRQGVSGEGQRVQIRSYIAREFVNELRRNQGRL